MLYLRRILTLARGARLTTVWHAPGGSTVVHQELELVAEGVRGRRPRTQRSARPALRTGRGGGAGGVLNVAHELVGERGGGARAPARRTAPARPSAPDVARELELVTERRRWRRPRPPHRAGRRRDLTPRSHGRDLTPARHRHPQLEPGRRDGGRGMAMAGRRVRGGTRHGALGRPLWTAEPRTLDLWRLGRGIDRGERRLGASRSLVLARR